MSNFGAIAYANVKHLHLCTSILEALGTNTCIFASLVEAQVVAKGRVTASLYRFRKDEKNI